MTFFEYFLLIPFKSFSIFQVILINGVLFRSILICFPSPEAALSAIAFKKLPLSLEPIEYTVLLSAPLTFLTSSSESSFSVNSKIKTFSAYANLKVIKIEVKININLT